jgi:hypothetical protein
MQLGRHSRNESCKSSNLFVSGNLWGPGIRFFRFDFLVFLARKSNFFWVGEEFWKVVAVGSQQTDLFWLSELDSGEKRTRRILIKLLLLYLCKRSGLPL